MVDETFRAGEKINIVRVEARNYTFLYKDNDILAIKTLQKVVDVRHMGKK